MTVAIAGAGSIGCYVGGSLAAAGRHVALLARSRIADEIATAGLTLTDIDGGRRSVPSDALTVTDDPEAALRDASHVLVAVKSMDTAVMAQTIARHAPANAVVVSLQNGVSNVATLRAALPGRRVLAAMVPFNVVSLGDGGFHRATSGDIQIARDADETAAALSVAGLAFDPRDDMDAVQWGKLLINLNNALVALSGLTLKEELSRRAWRRIFAAQIAEGLAVLRKANIAVAPPTPVALALMPHILRAPDWLFVRLSRRSAAIDAQARSSMWEDLTRGRPTEIDYLQGEIVALAARHGVCAPVNARVMALVKAAEAKRAGPPGLSAEDVI